MTLIACALLGACSRDEEHPPEYRPPYEKPLSCAELLASGFPASADPAPACAADGLSCPIAADAGCDADQVAVARCKLKNWELTCTAGPDASP